MRQDYSKVALATLCRLFGKTRHSWYDHQWHRKQMLLTDELVLFYVNQIRGQLPRLGTRKLYHLLQQRLAPHHTQIGRDHLFNLLAQHHMLVRQRRRKALTTDSHHWLHKYANLAAQLTPERPDQLWVSDITYIRLNNEFAYLSLITDAYSRKIVGFHLAMDLSVEGCLQALRMALLQRSSPWLPLIHHSDRGVQYCCKKYVDLLTDNTIGISMAEKGNPYENALAERLNGIIKVEFNLHRRMTGFEQTSKDISEIINTYNSQRPHASCDFLTPLQAHEKTGSIKKRWKNYKKRNQIGLVNDSVYQIQD